MLTGGPDGRPGVVAEPAAEPDTVASAMVEETIVDHLVRALEQLPASREIALRTVQVLDDPTTGAAEAAAVISADPALTARILRVANSVYYGLPGRVASTSFAITVVGFQTVRSLAVVGAAGLSSPDDFAPGFWARAVSVASGTSLLARRTGAPAQEGFSAGLLHDLGSALLRQHDRAGHDALVTASSLPYAEPLPRAEARVYGGSAASLGAQVLSAWHLPEQLCEAIGRRHDLADKKAPPLLRALQGGLVLADLAAPYASSPGVAGLAALSAAGVRPGEDKALAAQVRESCAQLLVSLGA